jgi:hypothetical protein
MQLLKQCQGDRIHNRNMDIITLHFDEDHILLVGELKERRIVDGFRISGERIQPGTYHHMKIALLVAISTLTIEAVEVQLPTTPHDDCAEMQASLEIIRGWTISPGFTSKIKRALGGVRGCVHLTTLLIAMAPAALQGYWVHKSRKSPPKDISSHEMEQYLVDTCYVWRKGGPLVRKLAAESKDARDRNSS